MSRIWIDTRYSFSISGKSGKYNGGNNYTKRMIPVIINGCPLYQVMLICKTETRDRVQALFPEKCECITIDSLNDINTDKGDIYYNPHVEDTLSFAKELAAFRKKNQEIRICLTIHDRRHREIQTNQYDSLFKNGAKSSFLLLALGRKAKGYITDTAVKQIIAQADQVFTVSNYSMQQLLRMKTNVPIKYYIQRIQEDEYSKENRNEGAILFVSAGRPEKNLIKTLVAFEHYILKSGDQKTCLVAVGIEPFQTERIIQSNLISPEILKRVSFQKYVNKEELDRLYDTCRFLLFPSRNEGYGVPIAEVMMRGMPSVAGERSAIPEVAGSAAIYVNPDSVESISDGISKMMDDGCYQIMLAAVKEKRKIVIDQMRLDEKMFIYDLINS